MPLSARIAGILLTILFYCASVGAQTTPDTLRAARTGIDSAVSAASRDSSARTASLEDSLGIRISPDALEDIVRATATDSAVADLNNNFFFLYGAATVEYGDVNLEAGKIRYEQATGSISAGPLSDTATSLNTFSQGAEKFTYDTLQYNFNSKRAIVRNARTQHGEGFVYSEQIKRNADASIYGWKNVYTTCALDTPHFGIRAKRLKIIPNRIIASGAANLMIEGVPTPIYLPFGVFPITETQRSGFRLPSYTIEQQRGLGLTKGGYYFYINDKVDLLLEANLFSKGSYSVSGVSSYNNRYHYNGLVSLSYAYNKLGEVYEPGSSIQKQYAVLWRHSTDAKARPGQTFNTSVNIASGDYYRNNSYNTEQIVQNQFQSNITYAKSWPNKPYNFTASLLHNQNTASGEVRLTLPQLNFYVSQITPFKRRNPVGLPKWYERITASYNFDAINEIIIPDSGFSFNNIRSKDFRNGIHHSIPVSASYTIARFINFNTTASYNEYWLTEQFYRYYNPESDKVDTFIKNGFFTARDFNFNTNFSTRIYGLKRFKRGRIAGLRHVLTPQVGFNYTPDFAAAPFKYYYRSYLDPSGSDIAYRSPFERSPVGLPTAQTGDFSSTLQFGIGNRLEMKTRSRDSAKGSRNITLIDGLSVNSAYNLAADSFQWSRVAIAFRTTILDNLILNGGASYDPYSFDRTTGRRSPITAREAGQGAMRFTDATFGMQASFRSKQRTDVMSQPAARTDEATRLLRQGGYNDYIDFNIPWSFNILYSVNAQRIYRVDSIGSDTTVFNHNIAFDGDFNLTPRWKVTFRSGYDVRAGALTITSIDIYRDLHCWEMRLGTIPFGRNRSYTFTLNVKASILHDLRLLRRRDFRDAIF